MSSMTKIWSYLFLSCDVIYTSFYIYSFLMGKMNLYILIAYVLIIGAMWVPMWDYLIKEIGETYYESDKEWHHKNETTVWFTAIIKLISYIALIISIMTTSGKLHYSSILDDPVLVTILSIMGTMIIVCLLSAKMIYSHHFNNVERFLSIDTSPLAAAVHVEMIPASHSSLSAEELTAFYAQGLKSLER